MAFVEAPIFPLDVIRCVGCGYEATADEFSDMEGDNDHCPRCESRVADPE